MRSLDRAGNRLDTWSPRLQARFLALAWRASRLDWNPFEKAISAVMRWDLHG
jgi:hypothetical protein